MRGNPELELYAVTVSQEAGAGSSSIATRKSTETAKCPFFLR